MTNTPENNLLIQAKLFYFDSCEKAKINPILFNKNLCEVGLNIIYLRNSKGLEIKIRFTKSYFFVEINGHEYFKIIPYQESVVRTKTTLLIESELLNRMKESCKKNKINLNNIMENLMSKYLSDNQ